MREVEVVFRFVVYSYNTFKLCLITFPWKPVRGCGWQLAGLMLALMFIPLIN